jgi:hypothetical protein
VRSIFDFEIFLFSSSRLTTSRKPVVFVSRGTNEFCSSQTVVN